MEAGEGELVEINGLSFFGDVYKFFRAQDHDLMLLELSTVAVGWVYHQRMEN